MKDQERRIKEQRTIEAARKNLMGSSGKLGVVCRFMGHPIHEHGGGFVDTRYLDAPWYDEINGPDSDIPTLDEDESISVIGWFFDGLSSGINMEIKYMDSENELTVRWQGYLVYREVRGDIDVYVPRPEWEGKVESLYQIAKKREQVVKADMAEEQYEESKRLKESWLQRMMQKWGLK